MSASKFWSLLSTYTYSHESNPCQMKNGFLAHLLYNQCHKNYVQTISNVKECSGLNIKKTVLRSKLLSLHNFVSGKLKGLQRGNTWDNLVAELDKFYTLPFDGSPTSSAATAPPEAENTPTHSVPVLQNVQVLRRDCKACISHKSKYGVMKLKADRLLKENRALRKQMTIEKRSANIELKKRLEEKAKKNKSMTKQLERKKSIESSLRMKCNAFKSVNDSLSKKMSRLEDSRRIGREVKNVKIKLAHQERKAEETNKELDRLKKENRKLQAENKELKDANDYLLSVQDEWSEEGESNRKSKEFDTRMRKATYRAVLAQCPVAQVGNLIKSVLNDLSKESVEKVPSKASAARMTHELSILSSIQTVEFLMNSSVATISWDATTELGHHINEIHIRSNLDVTHTVSIERLPGGRAEDYCNHTVRAINEMCSAYAQYSGMAYEIVRGQVLSKILSSLTDRAAVNHATSRLLNLHLGLELIELNCNLHVLDGIANRVRSSLKVLDGKTGLDGGNYSLASKVIYMVSKLRYKNTGDPTGFKAFLRMNSVPVGMFVRYVGNRLHVMFHMGGVLVHYLPLFLAFLEGSCKSEFSRNFLLCNLRQESLVSQLTALGLIGKCITGPWMKFVYKNADDLSNIEMSCFFKTAKKTIEIWSTNPSQMFVSDKDVFLQPLIPDLVLETLQSSKSSIVEDILKEILPAVAAVIEKQLSRYISGDLSEPSQELLEKTVSAAPHNIWAERIVGMTCNLWKRCPMATIGFLDAKIKAKTNKLMEWLDDKDEEEQEKLVAFGRKRAGLLRKKRRENEKGIDDEIEIRMKGLAQMRSMKSRKKADKEVKAAYKNRDADAVVFQSVSGFQRERLVQMIRQDGMIVGALFQHKWYDQELRKDCIWQARVVKIGAKTTIAYWCADGNEDDAEDYVVEIVELLTDMVMGDLVFD